MSYRRKVIVSDIPANLEVGLPACNYFRCGDVADLRSKLDAMLLSPGEAEYDMTKYDWDRIARQVYEVYEH